MAIIKLIKAILGIFKKTPVIIEEKIDIEWPTIELPTPAPQEAVGENAEERALEPESNEDSEEKEDLIKEKIQKVINVFETGTIYTDYSSVFAYNDGPNQIKQVTLGRGLTEFGNLPKLIENYAKAGGVLSNEFKKYVGRVGKTPSLYQDKDFTDLLKAAGKDPVMQKEQDKLFEERYWVPAVKFFDSNGFKLPLSMLVIYDSYIHSGSILDFLRKRFAEVPPAKGGDEKKWITQYVNVRHDWLANHQTIPILRKTIYRTNCFKDQIKNSNWDLQKPVNAHGTII